ncbi:MAG: DNA polymerase III subunit chi [Alphaproteobacteria bacterium]|nr:MAG: DNA polymerase III subunit chi [Alphaproteobacteria bacterium]
MADIRFYHLQGQLPAKAVARLLEKVLDAGHRALVLVASQASAERLDETLWTYEPASFLPHGQAGGPYADQQPVLIATGETDANGADVLLVLDDRIPDGLEHWQHCLYLFDGTDDDALARARARWTALRQAGHRVAYWQQNAAGGWAQKG